MRQNTTLRILQQDHSQDGKLYKQIQATSDGKYSVSVSSSADAACKARSRSWTFVNRKSAEAKYAEIKLVHPQPDLFDKA